MEALIQAAQLILSLSILVILHELGHFIPAKLFKTRVEKFYLFFDPWFSLFKFKKGDTEYGLGWLPLGGYVKISGMIDESMDKEQMKQPIQPWEFRAKPAWQRLIIMIGGVTVNVILGMLIYAATLFYWGDKYLPTQNLTDGIWCIDSMAVEMGLQNGDKILAINNKEIAQFGDIMPEMLYGGTVTVLREGREHNIQIPSNFIEQLIDKESRMLIYPRIPAVVAQLQEGGINENSGLQPKDQIIAINQTPIKYFDELKTQLQQYQNEEVTLTVLRNEQEHQINVTISENHTVGFAPALFSF